MSTQDKFAGSLAQEIRRVDGGHTLGAEALVDALMPFLQAHAAEAAHPQPAQDASKYQELLMAVSKKFPNESRHETALRYIKQTELQSCEPKCDAAMAKESGR